MSAGAEREDAEVKTLQVRNPDAGPGNSVLVVVSLLVAAVGSVGFAVAVVRGTSPAVQGLSLGLAMLALGVGMRRLFASLYPRMTAVEERHAPRLEPGLITPVAPVARRRVLARLLAAVGGLLGLSILAPITGLADARRGVMRETGWAEGVRLVDPDGAPLRPEDVSAAGVATVWPEDAPRQELSSVILVRLLGRRPQRPTILDWVVDGDLVAYSKICTHAGCPVGLFRTGDSELYCPCHQAQFDAARGAIPTFGPAARPLPQLPLGLDDEGFLIAVGDFAQPVGPTVG